MMLKVIEMGKQIASFFSLVRKLDLYKYPSVLTLLERDRYRWFGSFSQVQTIYNSSSEKVQEILGSSLVELLKIFPEDEISSGCKLDIKKTAHELKFPEIFLPNVSNYKVILGPLCWIFAMFGYSKRIKNVNLYRNYKNGKANRKLFFLFLSLHHLKVNKRYSDYWSLCNVILKDTDYLIANFNRTHRKWYKSMKLKDVLSLLKEITEIVNKPTEEIFIKLRRVYIPKTEDPKDRRVRPLGVPSLAYRVYLCMLNNLITFIRVDHPNTGDQHGYLPQKSILTAWKSILNNEKAFKYIYEFDLSKFFDSVPHRLINSILKEEYEMPIELRERILKLNQSIVELPSEDKVPEEDRLPLVHGKNQANPNKFFSINSQKETSRYWTHLVNKNYNPEEEISASDNPLIDLNGMNDILGKFWNTTDEAFLDSRKIEERKNMGVPQGGACSPTLATLCLDPLFKELLCRKDVKLIMYADDGLIFANSAEIINEIKDKLNKIVVVNGSKSSYFKYSGGYCKTLKFCGLVFDPFKYTLSSSTRFGSELEFGPCEQFLSYLKCKYSLGYNKLLRSGTDFSVKDFLNCCLDQFNLLNASEKLLLFFNPKVSGYLLNCLYLGSFSFQIREKDYFYEGLPDSWLNLRSGVVLWKMRFENSTQLESLIEFEIEWMCYNLISGKYNSSIFNFLSDDSLFVTIETYLKTIKDLNDDEEIKYREIRKTDVELILFVKDYLYTCFEELTCEKLKQLIELLELKNKVYMDTVSIKEKSIFLAEFFNINKSNCSSLAVKDLGDLFRKKEIVSSKYRFTYPKYVGPKNQKTIMLKESKWLRLERRCRYPRVLEQGLIK